MMIHRVQTRLSPWQITVNSYDRGLLVSLLVLHRSDRDQLTGSLLEEPGCPVVLVQ